MCKWNKVNGKWVTGCGTILDLPLTIMDYFETIKYCPYCGDEINIKEV